MHQLVRWLISVERQAEMLYREAAEKVQGDGELRDFLRRLVLDEEWHAQLMQRLADQWWEHPPSGTGALMLDRELVQRVEEPLKGLQRQVKAQPIDAPALLDAIAAAEASEWNAIFLYVLHGLADGSRSQLFTAAAIQAHEDRIIAFLQRRGRSARVEAPPRHQPPRRVLVAEDEAQLRRLLVTLLKRYGRVDEAGDGAAALDRLRGDRYDLILSDVLLPEMDGLDFLHQALAFDPHAARHFVLCTARSGTGADELVQRLNIPCLRKPFRLGDLTRTVERVLESPPEASATP